VPDEQAYWPSPVAPAPGPLDAALDLLERSIADGALIVSIGGLTNLMLLERRSPGILATAQITVMGGYIEAPRAGYPPWGARDDWNVQVDPSAALYVFAHCTPTLVPLAVTVETALQRAFLPALRRGGPLSRLLARQAEAFAAEYRYEADLAPHHSALPRDLINFQHDPLAVAVALGWPGATIETLPTRNALVGDWLRQWVAPDGHPTRIVTAVDGPRFNAEWCELVQRV